MYKLGGILITGFELLLSFFFLVFMLLMLYVVSHKYYGMHIFISIFTILLTKEYYYAEFENIFSNEMNAAIVGFFIMIYCIYMSCLKIGMAFGKIK